MKYFLVNFSDNWADEFDIEGFAVFNETILENVFQSAQNVKYPKIKYFGSNEFVEYSSFEDWKQHLNIQEISESDYQCLKRLNLLSFGEFIIPEG